jgi:ATP-dependent protease ClpP protease subunit
MNNSQLEQIFENLDPDQLKDIIFENRIIPIMTSIDESVLEMITSFFTYFNLKRDNKKTPIKLLIHTTGGSISCARKIYDQITFSSIPVDGYVMSECHSSGTLILSACRKRIGLPMSQYLLHSGEFDISFKTSHAYGESIQNQIQDFISESLESDKRYNDLFLSRIKISRDKLIELERFGERTEIPLSAEKALEIGLLTKIAKNSKDWIW